MDSKQFDQHIKQQLEHFESPFQDEHWKAFDQILDSEGLNQEEIIEENLIEQMKNYSAPPIPGDWDVMSQMLDQVEHADNESFDENVKQKVDRFEVPYNHQTWPILAKRLEEAEAIRRRLYIAKILELACVLLFVFTVFNFYPEIKQHVIQPAVYKIIPITIQDEPTPIALSESTIETTNQSESDSKLADVFVNDSELVPEPNSEATTQHASIGHQTKIQNLQRTDLQTDLQFQKTTDIVDQLTSQFSNQETTLKTQSKFIESDIIQSDIILSKEEGINSVSAEVEDLAGSESKSLSDSKIPSPLEALTPSLIQETQLFGDQIATIPTLDLGILHNSIFANPVHQKLYGNFISEPMNKKKVRFGIRTTVDANVLFFPEDNFYSDGKRISFAEQNLPTLGYGGGISIGWFGKRLAYEIGLLYSSKSFKPGRQLLIGDPLENSKVDFKAVQIDVVSVPVHINYYAKATGKFRFYVVGGMDFSLISQANYDLTIQRNFPLPLSITNTGAQASAREAKRIREHILDGAKFSSKSFVTAHAGFGLEQYLNHKLSLFAEPTYIYQVPFGVLNNRNGKHLQSLSLHFGARMPIN